MQEAGERDTYHLDGTEYVWDHGAQQLTRVVGATPLRLPRASDLTPPDLGRRLLRLSRTDPVTALPARRVAGRDAAGLRVTPADPETTIGRVDVWADPASALPLRVEVAPRNGDPLLFTEFVEVTDGAPDPAEVTPGVPRGADAISATAADLSGALRVLDAAPPPDRLAGRDRVTLGGVTTTLDGQSVELRPAGSELPGLGLYGSGLAGFALVPVSVEIARQAVDSAGTAGGAELSVPRGRAVALSTPLMSVVAWARNRSGVLLAGTVSPDVLQQALGELPVRRPS